MKKVLAIAPYAYLPFFSGGQKFIARFLEHLGNKLDLVVVSVAENDLSLARSYQIMPLMKTSFSRYLDRSLVEKIATIVKERQVDTIICEHPYLAWLVFAVRKRTGIKVIFHTHNIEHQRFRSMGKWWWPVLRGYEKRSFQKADHIFFITPEDKAFAVNTWHIDEKKCIDVPFGIDVQEFPSDRACCRAQVAAKHGIGPGEKIFSFNGLLDYKPNSDALDIILNKINPLLQESGLRYKIIISGKNLPAPYNDLKDYADRDIVYTGFTDDITIYLKATDIFLNPVLSGGGIKTKMVEAIGYGATVVSTETGATGIEKKHCDEKLHIITDNDWASFVQAIVDQSKGAFQPTPATYYDHYNWKHIIERVVLLT